MSALPAPLPPDLLDGIAHVVVTDEPGPRGAALRALRSRVRALWTEEQVTTECALYRRLGPARYLAYVAAVERPPVD